MGRKKKPLNPFYPLLVVVGLAFTVSACAYGVMAFRAVQSGIGSSVTAGHHHPLMVWMNDHGTALLMAELAVLAVLTFCAMGTDSYWTGRSEEKSTP